MYYQNTKNISKARTHTFRVQIQSAKRYLQSTKMYLQKLKVFFFLKVKTFCLQTGTRYFQIVREHTFKLGKSPQLAVSPWMIVQAFVVPPQQ